MRISNEEILELMTAPSSVVFLLKIIVPQVMVVRSRFVDVRFCNVLNQNVSASTVNVELIPGDMVPYASYRNQLVMPANVTPLKTGSMDIGVTRTLPLSNLIVLWNALYPIRLGLSTILKI